MPYREPSSIVLTRATPGWVLPWSSVLLIVTLGVRLLDPTGWLGSDDAAYYSAAEHILTGEPIQRVHHHYARSAVILPIAAAVTVLGHHPFTVALPSVIASILCVALVVLLGRRLLGWWEGLAAGTIVAVLPYFRVLSTTAFPDVHVCLWITTVMLLAAYAVRIPMGSRARLLWGLCGFAFGLAMSAKVFAIAAIAGVIGHARSGGDVETTRHGTFRRAGISFAVGFVAFQTLDGLFYQWAAGDFFFCLRATLNAQDLVPAMAGETANSDTGVLAMVWDRITMPARTTTSGWGAIGVAFWPVLLLAAAFERRTRPLVAWAVATYALVAFAPVSFKDGARAYPVFHGRHVLPACIPFALCLAWAAKTAATRFARASYLERGWPVLLAGVVALAYLHPRELNGFRDRATSRVGAAITELIASTQWNDEGDIYMTPSAYWRFRVLFPPPLRARLRVAVDDAAPDWWRTTCPDIVRRSRPLPPPGSAYLVATPLQLSGQSELWEYGVALPAAEVAAWRTRQPLATLVRGEDRGIGIGDANDKREAVLLLLGMTDPSEPRHSCRAPGGAPHECGGSGQFFPRFH